MGINGVSWARTAQVDRFDRGKLYATAFELSQNALVPLEFAEGPSPVDLTKIPLEFLAEFANSLTENHITNELVLAKRDAKGLQSTAEVETQWGETLPFTVVMPVSLLIDDTNLIVTGWNTSLSVPVQKSEPAAGEHWDPIVSSPKKGPRRSMSAASIPSPPRVCTSSLLNREQEIITIVML